MTRPPPTLYHYTCHHGHAALRRTRTVLPAAQHSPRAIARAGGDLRALAQLAWFTDLEHPEAWALGLTAIHITCNRSAYRWEVDPTDRPPIGWGRVRNAFGRPVVDALEGGPGAQPARWWVATWPIRVTYNPI